MIHGKHIVVVMPAYNPESGGARPMLFEKETG